MKRFAVIVATEEYTHFQPTPFCHMDAKLLKTTLLSYCDYAQQDVSLHLLSPDNPATPTELLKALRDVAQRTQKGDTVVFFYAGHGHVHNGEPYLNLPTTERQSIEQT